MRPTFSFFFDVARTRSTSAVSAESGRPDGIAIPLVCPVGPAADNPAAAC
jgi:hypothetical protein